MPPKATKIAAADQMAAVPARDPKQELLRQIDQVLADVRAFQAELQAHLDAEVAVTPHNYKEMAPLRHVIDHETRAYVHLVQQRAHDFVYSVEEERQRRQLKI
jgi:hypothetical protein